MKVRRWVRIGWLGLLAASVVTLVTGAEPPVRVTIGSKAFTESVILGEMLRHLAESASVETDHRRQLGGTRVLWNALLVGEIDVYPEYTGTLLHEILAKE